MSDETARADRVIDEEDARMVAAARGEPFWHTSVPRGPVLGLETPAPSYERPAYEHYLRVDVTLPDGGCMDVGLEDRESDDEAQTAMAERGLEYCINSAIEQQGNAKQIAVRLKALVEEWFPDRYWFAEIWTPSGAVKRYQVIQPAVVGGFRR